MKTGVESLYVKKSTLDLTTRLRLDLESAGFARFSGSEISDQLDAEGMSLAQAAAGRSGQDPYDPNRRGRAYATGVYFPVSRLFTPVPPYQRGGRPKAEYYQGEDLNADAKGQVREFDAVPDDLMHSVWLRELVALLFDGCPADLLPRNSIYLVGVHLITSLTWLATGVHGVPRILHRDGERVTAVILLRRSSNVIGGDSVIAGSNWAGRHHDDVNDGTLKRFTLDAPMDGFILDDKWVSYGVTYIRSADGAPAARSVLLVDFSPMVVVRD